MLRYSQFQPDLTPAERLFAAILKRAVRDARNKDQRYKQSAIEFLWRVAPSVAKKAGVPAVNEVTYFRNK